jgi:hypothetical protein
MSFMVSDCFFACSSALLTAVKKTFAEGGGGTLPERTFLGVAFSS